ncbi:hypothetical protein BKA70DRAFT_729912 [Coprinopsis sp. MPI-PUGE-AT-0042]|nr:hypothetical protein BKA70DRAFT_729912 [Coprinopsis sp. MPI-PUGE-AT-0042]
MPKAKLTTPAEYPSHPYPAQARNALTTIQADSAAGGVSQYAGYPSQPMLSQPMYSQPIHGGGYPQHYPATMPMGSSGGHVNPYLAAYGPAPGGAYPTQAPMYYVPAYNHPHGTPGAEPGHPQVYYVAAYPPGYGSPHVAGPPSGNAPGAAYSPPPGYGNPHGLANPVYQPPPSQSYSQMTAGGPGVPAPNPYAHSQGGGAPKAEPSAPTVATQRQPPPAQNQPTRSQVNASQPAYSPPPVLTQPLSRQGTMNQSMVTLPPSTKNF